MTQQTGWIVELQKIKLLIGHEHRCYVYSSCQPGRTERLPDGSYKVTVGPFKDYGEALEYAFELREIITARTLAGAGLATSAEAVA